MGGGSRRPDRGLLVRALLAIVLLRMISMGLDPVLENLMGGARDLTRLSGVEGSPEALAGVLFASWTFAAFGEEVAYRIVLMRGLSFALGDGRSGQVVAVVLQAAIFGLAHAYLGPTGIMSAAVHGLVLGGVTMLSRWSIWPAALAHGVNNTFGVVALFRGDQPLSSLSHAM